MPLIENPSLANLVRQVARKIESFVQKCAKNLFSIGGIGPLFGGVRLSSFAKIERKRIRVLDELAMQPALAAFYEHFIDALEPERATRDVDQRERRGSKPEVFFVFNIIHLFRHSVASHLKLVGDVAKMYTDHGIRVHLVILNHPYRSMPTNQNILFSDYQRVSALDLRERILSDCEKMTGLRSTMLKVCVLNEHANDRPLCQYIEDVLHFFQTKRLTKRDLVFGVGGHLGSALFDALVRRFECKKIYLMFNVGNPVSECVKGAYDYAMCPLPSRKVLKRKAAGEFELVPIRFKFTPFAWALESRDELGAEEVAPLQHLKSQPGGVVLMAAKQSMCSVLTREYWSIVNELYGKFHGLVLILVGTGDGRVEDFKRYIRIPPSQIYFISYSPNLFGFFRETVKCSRPIYALPRFRGGGFGTLLASLAAMPVVAFKENDAQAYLPDSCFASDSSEYVQKVTELAEKSLSYRKAVECQTQLITRCNDQVDQFYLELLCLK